MASFAGTSKTIVIRTSRETLGLVAVATALTFALAGAVHSKHEAAQAPAQAVAQAPVAVVQEAAPAQEDWAGHLAELTPAAASPSAEPMTSASLTVPKSQLALPIAPRPSLKPRPCNEPQPCALKAPVATGVAAAAPAHRQIALADKPGRPRRSLIGMLNPLNHLPDMSTVSRPFTYAGGTVVGWFKRL